MDAQPYITEFRWRKPNEPFTHDAARFRPPRYPNLIECIGRHSKVWPVDLKTPWLTVPKHVPNGLVIVHRSPRYRNDLFPWKIVREFYGDRLLMVGQPHEHEDFQRLYGKVNFHYVKDFLEMATLIDGSFLFIGNQSSANAIAAGLQHERIQETCLWVPDVVFPHANAQHCYKGYCVLPNDKGTPLKIGPKKKRLRDPMSGIPGGWLVTVDGQEFRAANFDALFVRVKARHPNMTKDELNERIASRLTYPFVEDIQADCSLVEQRLKEWYGKIDPVLSGIPSM
jgi:hypothetical protein